MLIRSFSVLQTACLTLAVLLLGAGCSPAEDSSDSDVAEVGGADAADDGDTSSEATAEESVPVTLFVLNSPSLTSFYQPIVEANGLDETHGLDVTFESKSPQALRTDFAARETAISAGATFLTDVALLNEQGTDTVFLFNIFDWWGTIVTPSQSGIESLEDLPGSSLIGALSTTNYAMFQMTAARAGVDVDSLVAQNAEPSGLIAATRADAADAVQLWEPAHSVLMAGDGDFQALDLVGTWQEETGQEQIPYVGVAAHRSWYEANRNTANRLYAMFQDVASFIQDNPDEAASLISDHTEIDVAVLQDLFGSPRLGFSVYPAADGSEALQPVIDSAMEIGLINEAPDLDAVLMPVADTASSS